MNKGEGPTRVLGFPGSTEQGDLMESVGAGKTLPMFLNLFANLIMREVTLWVFVLFFFIKSLIILKIIKI